MMVNIVDTGAIAERAKALYAGRLRSVLEPEHLHSFVAIEPDSGDFFLGQTLGDAIDAAPIAHPDRITHTIRIGHAAALEIGRLE